MRLCALITGASRGIGAACATEFAKAGYDLSLCCRQNKEQLETLASALREAYGIAVITFVGDVADSSFVNEMVEATCKEYGKIDVLLNNAGISKVGLLQDMTDEMWHEIVDVNLSSAFYAARAVIPSMVAAKSGRILSISSVWGSVGASCEVAYSATKGGLNAMTKALAKELAPSKIAVNAIACGAIDTSMNHHLEQQEKEMLAQEIPFGRFGTPEEVGKCAVVLAQMPEYMTGQIVTLDGGWQ